VVHLWVEFADQEFFVKAKMPHAENRMYDEYMMAHGAKSTKLVYTDGREHPADVVPRKKDGL